MGLWKLGNNSCLNPVSRSVAQEDRIALLHSLVTRVEAGREAGPEAGIDQTFVQDLQSLTVEERDNLSRILIERERKRQNS